MRKRSGYIRKRGPSFQIAYRDINHVRQFETYATKEEATVELAKRLAEVAQGIPVSSKPNTVRFGELCVDVVTDYQVQGFKSVKDTERRFRLHIIPVFGDRKAISITTSQIRAYIVQRQSQGAKNGTINRELQTMKHAFLLAKKEKRFLAEPPHFPMLAETPRQGFFTREEVDRLCSHLKPPLDSFVLFGFLTGWRIGEIRNLRWSNVDFAAGEIRLDVGTTKNGEGRVFPILDEIRALLLALQAEHNVHRRSPNMVIAKMSTSAAYVFSISGKPLIDWRKSWRRANHLAGLPCIYDMNGKLVKAVRTFHCLRRSAARDMSNKGIRREIIKQLMGHKTDAMFYAYSIVSPQDLKSAADILNHREDSKRERS